MLRSLAVYDRDRKILGLLVILGIGATILSVVSVGFIGQDSFLIDRAAKTSMVGFSNHPEPSTDIVAKVGCIALTLTKDG